MNEYLNSVCQSDKYFDEVYKFTLIYSMKERKRENEKQVPKISVSLSFSIYM